jgi:[ribosomal protein S5]-alanine N-acetyltransferase
MSELDEFDIGYRLMKKFWGKGYATEAAEACLELGFTQFELKLIVGRAMPANLASVRVLEKIGLTYHENRMEDGVEEVVYIKHKS